MEKSSVNITFRKDGRFMRKFIVGYDVEERHNISMSTVRLMIKQKARC